MPTKKTTTPKKSATKKAVKKTITKKVVKKSTTKKVAKKTLVKKAAPKKATKKTATKKPTKRSSMKRVVLVEVTAVGPQCFWVHNGEVLATLGELQQSLKKMEAASYAHHVSKGHNDFAAWVEGVLENPACAADLRKKHTQKATTAAVTKHLK